MDRQIGRSAIGRDSRTLAQFHHAAVAQLQDGIGVGRGADLDSIAQILAGGQRPDAGGGNFIQAAVDGLHNSPSGAVALPIEGDPDGEPGGGYHDCGGGPSHRIPRAGCRTRLRSGHRRHASFINTAAGHALVQVVLQQQGAGAG